MEHIVIIGNGIAGITTAREARKNSDARITVISGETDHFFSRTALMYIYMGHMKYEHTKPYEDWFWEKNRIELRRDWVESIDFDIKDVLLESGKKVAYTKLVISTGSKSNKFGWPGQDLDGVQGLYSYQDLGLLEENSKDINRAVVVGGGLIGIELAEMLHSRDIPVTFLVREENFWDNVLPLEESKMINRHILEHGIDLRLSTELEEILDDGSGRVKAVKTKDGEIIDCQLVGLTAGVSPNVDFLRNTELKIDKGVIVNEFSETNIPDVYAAGDCSQIEKPKEGRRPIEAVWYAGRMMGEALGKTLAGTKTEYDPGIWFNSAKFFDIEYQTYGTVSAQRVDDEDDFYWEDESDKICLRLVFDKKSKALIGVNNFGIRLRHDVVEDWIRHGRTVEYSMEHLRDANFDPEFYKKYEQEIVDQFNRQNDSSISLKKKSWKRILEAVGV